MKPPRRHLVYVEWEDAFGPGQTWREPAQARRDRPAMMYAVGYLLKHTRRQITLAPYGDVDLSQPGAMVCGEMVIPRSQVRRMWALKIGREMRV